MKSAYEADLNPHGIGTVGHQPPMADIGQAACREPRPSTGRPTGLADDRGPLGQVLPREPQHRVADALALLDVPVQCPVGSASITEQSEPLVWGPTQVNRIDMNTGST
jgi:hypothetical protein